MDTPPTALKSARGVPSELPAMLMVLGWCMQASAAGAELIHVRTVSAIQTAWSDRAPHGQHARRQCSAADGAAIARESQLGSNPVSLHLGSLGLYLLVDFIGETACPEGYIGEKRGLLLSSLSLMLRIRSLRVAG